MSKKRVLGEDVHIENIGLVKQVENQMATRGQTVMDVPLDKVREKENVRKEYRKIEELADSIRAEGLIQPIEVTPVQGDTYDILFGHRRFRAMLLLQKESPENYFKIRAIIREPGSFDPARVKILQIVENIQRDDLGPLELKSALEALRESGLSNREIAEKLGKSEGYVKVLFSAMGAVNENPELKVLMESYPGITSSDLVYLRVLPKDALLKVAEEKAKGLIKTRAELEARIQEVRQAAYGDYRSKQEEKQKYQMPFIKERDGGGWRLRPMAYEPGKTSSEEKKRIIDTLRELLIRMESVTP
jgi:ParB family chromosome partitioning protein